jgi:hypothetical protein
MRDQSHGGTFFALNFIVKLNNNPKKLTSIQPNLDVLEEHNGDYNNEGAGE